MSKLAGVFLLGVFSGWIVEWIFTRLFIPNPEKKLRSQLDASRKENETLQQQNRELQDSLNSAREENSKLSSQFTDAQAVTSGAAADDAVKAEAAASEAPASETAAENSVDAASNDELTRISGIGPKLAEAMRTVGINSYAQIADMSEDALNGKLASTGIRYVKASVKTWPAQAKFAAAGDWDGLRDYQKSLKK